MRMSSWVKDGFLPDDPSHLVPIQAASCRPFLDICPVAQWIENRPFLAPHLLRKHLGIVGIALLHRHESRGVVALQLVMMCKGEVDLCAGVRRFFGFV